ncbi:MAG: hypothetical protein M3436_13965 [Pseudomonadota bacterium]|nr:hypothetical protein [Pseudomonadota bacterium]
MTRKNSPSLSSPNYQGLRHALLVIFLTTLIGCAAPSAIKIDSTQGARGPIDKMLFIVRDAAGGFRAGEDPLKALTREVKEDLVRAGYAVSDPWDLGLSEREIRELIEEKYTSVVSAYGHLLAATVHPLRTGSTPAGFSMSFGDSDPRAQNFQRVELIPISCALVNTRSAREEASLREDKPAPGRDDRWVPQEAGPAKGVEALAGDIRAVCDKLLAELGVARKVAKSEPSSPADPVPAVRVEIAPAEENTPETVEPAPAPDIDEDTSLKSENALPQASGSNSAPSQDPAVPAPEPLPATVSAPPKSSPVTAKPSTGNEGRKQVKIINPGNTVILEFGPDRRH